jgi:hypothetical protein
MQTVVILPEFDRTSWQPVNGFIGEHVLDRAKHTPSQSLAALQLLFASGVIS